MSKSPEEGKGLQEAAEEAWEAVAEEHGIDDFGDPIVEDDDEPAIVAEADDDTDDDAPALEAEEEVVEATDDETSEVLEATDDVPRETSPLIAPHAWKQEWKDQFNKITDPAMKAAVLEQNKNMNTAFTQKMTEVANLRRDGEGIQKAVGQHRQRLELAGITPETAIQRSLAWDAHIQRDPHQGLLDMAKAYGVDLGVQQADDQYLTPSERQMKQVNDQQAQSIQQLQQQQQQWNEYQQQQDWSQRQANANMQLDEFINATDEAGNQKHPFIENVAGEMTRLVQGGYDLDSAYNMAVSVNPDIVAAQEQQRTTARLKRDKAKADKVRQASRSGIVSKPTGKASAPAQTVEQSVAEAYNQTVNAQ